VKKTLVITLFAVLAACSSISVTNDWDPAVDFSGFQTFAIMDEERQINRLNDQRIVAAIVADLTSKGLQQAAGIDQADLAIGFQVATENRTSYQTVHNGWGASGYRRSSVHWRGTTGTSRTTQTNYTVGTLLIAIFAAANKELVWEASGSDRINQSGGPEQSEQRINESVMQILETFPPNRK
jgi:hypothetical protein